MQIRFNGTLIDLPGDGPIDIIIHRKDNVGFCTTNDKDFYGIRIKKGDREAPDKEENDISKFLDAVSMPSPSSLSSLGLVPFNLGKFDSETIDKKGFWEDRRTRKDTKDERRGQRAEGKQRGRPTKGRGR